MENNQSKEKKKSKKRLNQDSAAYKRYREKANARKRKFLDKTTSEQKEIKRLKDREYYQRKKAEKKFLLGMNIGIFAITLRWLSEMKKRRTYNRSIGWIQELFGVL